MGKIWEVFAGKRNAAAVYGLNFEYDVATGPNQFGYYEPVSDTVTRKQIEAGVLPSNKTPAEPTQFETDMSAFTDLLNQYTPQLLNSQFAGVTPEQQAAAVGQLGGIGAGIGGIAQRLENIGSSGIDPAFQRLAQAQISQLSSQQQAQQAQQSEQFSRRGLGGSSAAMNAGAALSAGFGQQQQNLMSQLGVQGLQRADLATQQALAARGQQAGIAGQQFGVQQAGAASRNQAEEARLQSLVAGLQTSSLPLALQTAQTAAEKAGDSSGGGGKK